MPAFNALYYPTWNPPAKYLRSVLLFFDRFEVIIPTDVPANYDEQNSRVLELLPDAFKEHREANYEIQLDEEGWMRFEQALDLIVEQTPPSANLVILSYPDGTLRIEDRVLTHDAKMSHRIKRLLEERGLYRPEFDTYAEEIGREGFHIVDERASCLILSLLADTLARKHRLRTLTDEPVGFALNSLNAHHGSSRVFAEAKLASAIITVEVPETIGVLSAMEYVELRKRFEEVRLPFQRAVRLLCDDHMLATFSDEKQLDEAVTVITIDYSRAVQEFRRSLFAAKLTTWASLALGTLGTGLSFAGNCALGAIGAGLGVAVQVYDKLSVQKPEDSIGQSQRLICGLRRELFDPQLIRRLATVE